MSVPCAYDDPCLLDDFEVLLDDCQGDLLFLQPQRTLLELPPVKTEVATIAVCDPNSSAYSKAQRKPRKSSSAKSITKITTSLIAHNPKPPTFRLTRHAFPSFDRSDSTIYFASTFARMSNNGDEKGLNKLVTTHCAKDTEIVLREGVGANRDGRFCVPLTFFLDMMAINNVVNPDTVSCMHSTKVDGNQIFAVLYSKHTDSAEMYDYRGTVIEPKYRWLYCGRRKDLLTRNLGLDALDVSKRGPILDLLDKNVDVEMYYRAEVTLTLHERTKKIVDFKKSAPLVCTFGSITITVRVKHT